MKIRHVVGGALMAVLVMLSVGYVYLVYQASAERKSARCQAAQATVFAEMDLITTAGKFPSDETANRWRVLMGWC